MSYSINVPETGAVAYSRGSGVNHVQGRSHTYAHIHIPYRGHKRKFRMCQRKEGRKWPLLSAFFMIFVRGEVTSRLYFVCPAPADRYGSLLLGAFIAHRSVFFFLINFYIFMRIFYILRF